MVAKEGGEEGAEIIKGVRGHMWATDLFTLVLILLTLRIYMRVKTVKLHIEIYAVRCVSVVLQ